MAHLVSDTTTAVAGHRHTLVSYRGAADEDQEMRLVLQLSMEQQARDEERRRMAGLSGTAAVSDDDEDEDEDIDEWLQSNFTGDIVARAPSAPEVPTSETRLLREIPFEEQLRLTMELSLKQQQPQQIKQSSPIIPPVNLENDDEMLKKALAMSLDPSEQVVTVVAIRARKRSPTPMVSSVPVSSSSCSSDEENDPNLARAQQLSRQAHARHLLQEALEGERAVNASKRQKGSPRPIVIDGNNVAFNRGNHQKFSAEAISYCYQYFSDLGHTDVVAFCTPGHGMSEEDQALCQRMSEAGFLKIIGRKRYGNTVIGHYDDLFILRAAKEIDGIIVSNDKFRDVANQYPDLSETIKSRVLPFQFKGEFVPAPYPLGRGGPNLTAFLQF